MQIRTVNPSLPFKQFQLGNLELTIISDGYQVMKPVHPIFAPLTESELVEQLLKENFRSTDQVDLSLHILLIKKGDKLIMIDSGLGNEEPTAGYLQEALAAAGFKPTDITDIALTHGHLDHIGGLVTSNDAIAFPAANIHLPKTEYNFWTADDPDFSQSPMKNNPGLLAGLITRIKNILAVIKPKLQLIDQSQVLFDCIRLVAAPGHTPGHTLINVFSGEEELLHIADLIHSDVLLFPHPEWGFLFDTDLEQASATRRNILEKLANHKMLALAYHLPWPGLGYVRHKADAFEWVPKAYASPNH